MKRLFLIYLLGSLTIVVLGQHFGQETWTEINHEVKIIAITNHEIQCELERLLFCAKDTSIYDKYKYFHLYVKEKPKHFDLEFRLSNYPYKSNSLIGVFNLKGYCIFVHNKLPGFLKTAEGEKKYSYTEHKLGDLLIMEDDTPSWIIEYKNFQFKVLHYPSKLY